MTTETIKLTRRQEEILSLLERGATNENIAEALSISAHTVKVHMWRLFKKIGVSNRLSAVYWYRNQPDQTSPLFSAFDSATDLVEALSGISLPEHIWPKIQRFREAATRVTA